MLLPRRGARPAHHQPACRQQLSGGRRPEFSAVAGMGQDLRARRLVSVMALLASLAALALIMHDRHGWLRPLPEAQPQDHDVVPEPSVTTGRTVNPAEDRRYRALGDFVARKYSVSPDMAYDLVQLAHSVGQQIGLDPLLIIAVIAIESRFNPIAESIAGAKGLMQIIPRYHTAKFEEYGGEKAVFDPVANVKVGARILKDYIRLTGNESIALQMYAGALKDGEDQYTTRVVNEQQRLKQVVAPAAKASARPSAPVSDSSSLAGK